VLLAVVTLMMALFAVAFFVFDIDADKLNKYGYGGLFVVSLISAASIVLPMPGVAAIAGAGALLDPLLGIPVPIMVALVAGPAEAIGEATGYAAGYGGRVLFKERPSYPRVQRWMARRGILTMFALSAFPNPLVDVAGLAAGAVKMPLTQFYLGVLPGKLVKNFYLAAGGLAVGELVQRLFG
jgi:membrane protein YqaA with SNARE-associated domain